uniref:Deoxynucleotidyltransferase terminal-interacting protein 1 n=1 Tax=Laticauda laticaudata TaxID=8630 RepID=A0A8C5SHN2_LATLA
GRGARGRGGGGGGGGGRRGAGGGGEGGAYGRGIARWNMHDQHAGCVQRRGRVPMMTSFTDPVVSMDLLRAVLQPSINEEIQAVFGKYMKFFQKAAGNVRENVGEDVDTEQLIQETCRSCLEQAKLLFCDGKRPIARVVHEVPAIKVKSSLRVSSFLAQEQTSKGGRAASKGGAGLPLEPLQTLTLPLSGSRALGMGGTRGRLYIKHPHLFKYAADPQDKHWLAQEQYMRATGGKMVSGGGVKNIQDLAASDEYRGSQELKLDELKPFSIPSWMIAKMQRYMKAFRNVGRAASAAPGMGGQPPFWPAPCAGSLQAPPCCPAF